MSKETTTTPPTATSSKNLKHTYRRVCRLLPSDGDLQSFIQAVIDCRRRPLTIRQAPATGRGGVAGWCLVYDDHDEIYIDQAASPAARTVTLCHEIFHLFLGHDHGPKQHMVHPDIAARIFARDTYADPHELETETLATQLATELRRRQQLTASYASGDGIGHRLR